MSKKSELKEALDAWKKDINSEPFNHAELERKAREQAASQKGGK